MQRRHGIIALSLGVAFLALAVSIFVPWQPSHSVDAATIQGEVLSSDNLATIKVTGDASKRMEPDQVTVTMAINTQPIEFPSLLSTHQNKVSEVIEKLKATANEDNELSIRFGPTYLNPNYGGGGYPADSTFTTYVTVPITTNINDVSQVAEKVSKAGFRIENMYVSTIPPTLPEPSNSTSVSIISGASLPNLAEYYTPNRLVVSPGTTVTWTNHDTAAHTVTSGTPSNGPDSKFDSALFATGQTFSYQFNTEGVYEYFCMVHPWMTGKVIVSDGSQENDASAENNELRYQVNMNIVVDTQPDKLPNVVKKYQERFENLTSTLQEIGITVDKNQQTTVSFNPTYYGPGQYSTYNAYSQIIVKTDMQNIDNITNIAKTAGANIENVYFSVSDSAIDKARKELTPLALESATNRAVEIIEPLGSEIKGIKRIETNSNPINAYGGLVSYRGVGITPYYDPGQQSSGEVTVSLSVEFEVGK